jgi:hypothetical protein
MTKKLSTPKPKSSVKNIQNGSTKGDGKKSNVMSLHDISSINENDMNLNQSVLREALLVNTPSKKATIQVSENSLNDTKLNEKFTALNSKIDDIYASLS